LSSHASSKESKEKSHHHHPSAQLSVCTDHGFDPGFEGTEVGTSQEDGILAQLSKLHPAQLKLLLLVDPDKSKQIQAALEAG
jgi:hypothetical protein